MLDGVANHSDRKFNKRRVATSASTTSRPKSVNSAISSTVSITRPFTVMGADKARASFRNAAREAPSAAR
jgi:hypothetical protein